MVLVTAAPSRNCLVDQENLLWLWREYPFPGILALAVSLFLSVFMFLLHKTDALQEGEWGTCSSMLVCGLSASVWCVHFRS